MDADVIMKYFKGVPDDETKINPNICKACGGMCCNNVSCHIAPGDFIKVSKDIIRRGIDEGLFSIDWWDGHPIEGEGNISFNFKAYYLRIRHKDARAIDASVSGKCIFLEENGCRLPFGLRPRGARNLIPSEGETDCPTDYSKKECAIDWLPYHDMLEELYNEYKIKGEYTANAFSVYAMIKDVFAPLMEQEVEGHDRS